VKVKPKRKDRGKRHGEKREFAGEIVEPLRLDRTAAAYIGTVIMTVSGLLLQPIGVLTGLSVEGIAAVVDFRGRSKRL
jgi:hypothetical protein